MNRSHQTIYWVCLNYIILINWILAEIGSGEALDGNTEASNLKEEDEESEEEDDDPGGSILIDNISYAYISYIYKHFLNMPHNIIGVCCV